MDISFQKISAGLSASLAGTVTAIQTFLTANNPMSIVDVEAKYRTSMGNNLDILLTWRQGGANYSVQGFRKDEVSDATTKANAWFVANPNFRLMHLLDVSNPYRRRSYRDELIVLGIADYSIDLHLNRQMAIVQAAENIAAGATGVANIMGCAGPTGATIQIINRRPNIWFAGNIGWAASNPVDGTWIGYFSCC